MSLEQIDFGKRIYEDFKDTFLKQHLPAPLILSDYWLLKRRDDGETVGVIRRGADVPGMILIKKFGIPLAKVEIVTDSSTLELIYSVKTWNEEDQVACSHYLQPITESEGKTYIAMKLPFVDAGY